MATDLKARELATLGWVTAITNQPLEKAVANPEAHVRSMLPPDAPQWLVDDVTDGVRMYLPAE